MDVVRLEERLLDRAVGVEEVLGEVEHLDLRVGAEVQFIDFGVGQEDVLVEADLWRVAGQDLRDDHVGFREFFAQVGEARLHALGDGGHAGLRGEEHVVVADHQHDRARLDSVDAAVVETPQHVLGFVAADADVDGLGVREGFQPRIIEHAFVERAAPLLGDRVTDEQDVARAWIRLDVGDQLRVRIDPGRAAPGAGGGHGGPELRQVLAVFAAWSAVVFRLTDEGFFFGRERPARRLRVGRLVGVFEGG